MIAEMLNKPTRCLTVINKLFYLNTMIMKKLITLLNYLVLSLFLLNFVGNIDAQSVGDQAPDFTLSTVNGTSFTLSNQQGKVVFIFIFGYACPHCLANGNNTQTGIYQKYKNNEDFVDAC
jgi:cytochrome oxidase Cu insertion factor (SCO1/SenC/PrrC family)